MQCRILPHAAFILKYIHICINGKQCIDNVFAREENRVRSHDGFLQGDGRWKLMGNAGRSGSGKRGGTGDRYKRRKFGRRRPLGREEGREVRARGRSARWEPRRLIADTSTSAEWHPGGAVLLVATQQQRNDNTQRSSRSWERRTSYYPAWGVKRHKSLPLHPGAAPTSALCPLFLCHKLTQTNKPVCHQWWWKIVLCHLFFFGPEDLI